MSITSITTHIEPTDAAAVEAAFAPVLALAEAQAAAVTALVFHAEPELTAATLSADAIAAREEAAAAHVREAAARLGIACEVRGRSSFAYGIGEVFADHLRVSDLGVLALHGAPGGGQRMLIGGAVFDSGRPMLLLPAGQAAPSARTRAVVAWDATASAVRAVHAALPFLRGAEETLVLTVSDDKEMRHGQSGIELTRLLARHGARATFATAPRGRRSVLQTIAATAQEHGAGLLVMGAVRHAPLRDMLFGSATRDVMLDGPPLPVLLAA